MILSPNELESLLEMVKQQTLLFIGTSLGPQYLSDTDKKVLKGFGIDLKNAYGLSTDHMFLNYQLGMLSRVLKEDVAKALTYSQLRKMVQQGKYIQLNQQEKAVLESVKMQTLSDIRSQGDKIFSDINKVLNESNLSTRQAQEELIRETVYDGLKNRDQLNEITKALHQKTGDWSRDFSRIVQYTSHRALSEGRAAIIRRGMGDDSRVYVLVQKGACKHCIQQYLTNGMGSAPKIFKLGELEANGTNIGKKMADWQPVMPPLHPHCRCSLMDYNGGEWDGSRFIVSEDYKPKVQRPKVKVVVGDKVYMV